MEQKLVFKVRLPVAAEVAYAWHEHPSAFSRLTPAWDSTAMLATEGIRNGGRATLVVRAPGGVSIRWIAEHGDVRVGQEFSDRQVSGPFRSWQHRHLFVPVGAAHSERRDVIAAQSELRDEITYSLPFTPLSDFFVGRLVRRRIERMFAYRQRVLRHDLEFWSAQGNAQQRFSTGHKRMRILLTGSSGLIGQELTSFLRMGGHEVFVLTRRQTQEPAPQTVIWDLLQPQPSNAQALLDGQPLDAVIHLAGEGIAAHRWSAEYKKRLIQSRAQATENLLTGLAQLGLKPRVFLSASGVGYYGDAGDARLEEDAPRGTGFLAELAEQWEAAARRAENLFSARCVQMRMGAVMTSRGGALARMLLPFQMGLGGPLGNGRQWMSWISLDDVLYAFAFALETESLRGPVNLVAPEPVTNAAFTRALGRALHRPAVLPAPAFALRLALGEMANELLLCSQRAVPSALLKAGFQFRYPNITEALQHTV